MKTKPKNLFLNNRHVYAAFFLPVLIVVLAFAVTGIYPFGDSQIAIIDMYHQYVPFLSELQNKLQHGGSLLYTWNGAGGCNFWCLLAYYCASPLNLLLVLFPAKLIMEGITSVLLIKMGLAGSLMCYFLTKINAPKAESGAGEQLALDLETTSLIVPSTTCPPAGLSEAARWQFTALSSLYALSAYVMGYFWCIMWMDAIMLLPLCMLGLSQLIDGKSPVLYTVTLALIIVCNYYIGIMVCIFIALYYPVMYFIHHKGAGAKFCVKTTVKAAAYSVIAAGISAFMLLPTYFTMQNTYYISSDLPDHWTFLNDPLDVVNQVLPATQLTFREGLPNLYCGMATVILFVLFLVNNRVPLREKILNGAFLVFLFFSLNVNYLDYFWHGCHFPNQLPFRYSFVACFLLVAIAGRSLSLIDAIRPKVILAIIAVGTGYYLIANKILTDKLDDTNVFFYFGIAALAAYGILLVLWRNKKIGALAFTLMLLVFVTGELSVNTILSFEKTGNTTRSLFFENAEDIETLVGRVNGEAFARTELNKNNTLNSPALYHYKGLSQFSSSINSNLTSFMEDMGFEGSPAKNRTNYNPKDPVSNALFGVKYLIAKSEPLRDSDFTQIAKSGSSRLYENNYPLSVGYLLPDSIRLWDVYSTNPFNNLEDYVRTATNGECNRLFHAVNGYKVTASDMIFTDEKYGQVNAEVKSLSATGEITLRYRADRTCKHYVYVEADNAESITVERKNSANDIDVREDSGSIINIGKVKKGEKFKIHIVFEPGKDGTIYSYVRTLNQRVWDKAYGMMSSDMLNITQYTDRSITGHIDATKDGILVLSIPYEQGWTLKVDGKGRTISEQIGDVWITTDLTRGSHEIELVFLPPGLKAGILISIVSILLLAALELLFRRRRARIDAADSAAPEEDEPLNDVFDLP